LCTHFGSEKQKPRLGWLRGFAWPARSEAVSVNRHGSAGAGEPCSVDRRDEQGGHRGNLRYAGAVVGASGNWERMMAASTRMRKREGHAALQRANARRGGLRTASPRWHRVAAHRLQGGDAAAPSK
jgi:hypothetical protein